MISETIISMLYIDSPLEYMKYEILYIFFVGNICLVEDWMYPFVSFEYFFYDLRGDLRWVYRDRSFYFLIDQSWLLFVNATC